MTPILRAAILVVLSIPSHSQAGQTTDQVLVSENKDLAQVLLTNAAQAENVKRHKRAFPATRYPFVPKLIENREPALCKIVLDRTKAEFLSPQPFLTLGKLTAPGITWVDLKEIDLPHPKQETERYYDPPRFLRIDLDLDGDGHKRTIIEHDYWHSWRGKNYFSYVFDSPETFDRIVAEFKRSGASDVETQVLGKGRQYYPEFEEAKSSSQKTFYLSDWTSHDLFRFKNRYYFSSSGTDENIGSGLAILRLRGNGTLELACSVQASPSPEEPPEFSKLSAISSYLKVLINIGHAGGGPCGTLNAEVRHDAEAGEAVARASFRPWAVSRNLGYEEGVSYFIYDEKLMRFMEHWSLAGVWNRREYQTYLNHVEPAIDALTKYLQKSFGLDIPSSKKWGRRVFEEMTAAWFLFSKDWNPSEYGDADSVQEVIQRGDAESVEKYLAEKPDSSRLGSYLLDAVESPRITRMLLAAGADVNSTNTFGKTALMTAAHLNRPDVVGVLLEHKADPNLKTHEIFECGITIERGDRTALMYAAENANPEVMTLLVRAGSALDVRDSKGNGLGFYLSKNPFLADSERRMDIKEILKQRQEQQRGPSFDCKNAKMRIDQLICGDEILAFQDRNLAAAYKRWSSLAKTEDAGKDQRRWLAGRNRECDVKGDPTIVTCLQQWTRARIRYLHNRIEETTPKPG